MALNGPLRPRKTSLRSSRSPHQVTICDCKRDGTPEVSYSTGHCGFPGCRVLKSTAGAQDQ